MLRAKVHGEWWVLVNPRAAWLNEVGHAVVPAGEARAFTAQADIAALARMLGVDPRRASLLELGRVLADRLRWGALRLLREVRVLPKVDPQARIELPFSPTPVVDDDPVLDDPRALIISRCDPFFASGYEPLNATYLLREFESLRVVVRIRNPRVAGEVVFERELGSGEKRNGPHSFAWDGVFQLGPDAGRLATPLDGPFELEVEHGGRFVDRAEFCVLFHSIDLGRGSWHLGESEPTPAERVRWARWRLAELGHHGGPVDANEGEALERAILGYRAAHSELGREGPLDQAVLDALEADLVPRAWLSNDAFGLGEVIVRSDFSVRHGASIEFEARAPVAVPLAARVRLVSKSRSPVDNSKALGAIQLRWSLTSAPQDRSDLVWDASTVAGYRVSREGDTWYGAPLTDAAVASHVAQSGILIRPALEGDRMQVRVELALERAEHASAVLSAHDKHLGKRAFEAMSAVFELRPFEGMAHVVEVEDLTFATDRKLLLPHGGLGALIVILAFAREYPDKVMLVTGHTDTAGSDAHNLELSEARARNVQLWLSGDGDAWAADCQEHFERADFKAIHLWAHEHLGWNCHPGEIDNDWHTKARVARDVFRTECEKLLGIELEHHVAQNQRDWRSIHDLYALVVARYLEMEVEELDELRRSLAFAEPATLACGEEFPRVNPNQDGQEEASNRRVEVIFFEPNEVPDLTAEPAGVEIYASTRFSFESLEPWDLDPMTPAIFEIDIVLADHWHRQPLRNTAYTIEGPLPERLFHREGATDGEGALHEPLLPSGHYELTVADVRLTVMAHPVGFTHPGHPQQGPNFRDVYRVPAQGTSPVYPAWPDSAFGEWEVPQYEEGPPVEDDDVFLES